MPCGFLPPRPQWVHGSSARLVRGRFQRGPNSADAGRFQNIRWCTSTLSPCAISFIAPSTGGPLRARNVCIARPISAVRAGEHGLGGSRKVVATAAVGLAQRAGDSTASQTRHPMKWNWRAWPLCHHTSVRRTRGPESRVWTQGCLRHRPSRPGMPCSTRRGGVAGVATPYALVWVLAVGATSLHRALFGLRVQIQVGLPTHTHIFRDCESDLHIVFPWTALVKDVPMESIPEWPAACQYPSYYRRPVLPHQSFPIGKSFLRTRVWLPVWCNAACVTPPVPAPKQSVPLVLPSCMHLQRGALLAPWLEPRLPLTFARCPATGQAGLRSPPPAQLMSPIPMIIRALPARLLCRFQGPDRPHP